MTEIGQFVRVVYCLIMLFLFCKRDKREKAVTFNIWTVIITTLFITIIGTKHSIKGDKYDISKVFYGSVVEGLFDASVFITYILILVLIYSYLHWRKGKKLKTNPNVPTYDPKFPVKFSEYLRLQFFEVEKAEQ